MLDAQLDETYTIKGITTSDAEMEKFLFTLGCYQGEEITLISKLKKMLVVVVKDARYSIDADLASVILI